MFKIHTSNHQNSRIGKFTPGSVLILFRYYSDTDQPLFEQTTS